MQAQARVRILLVNLPYPLRLHMEDYLRLNHIDFQQEFLQTNQTQVMRLDIAYHGVQH